MNEQDLLKAINDSGFPLQIGLKQLVRGNQKTWTVILTEHQWIDPLKGEEKFIDLVLRQGADDYPVRLVIECKRSRETGWIFLREPGLSPGHDRPRSVRSRVVSISETWDRAGWWDIPFNPGFPKVSYCVIRKNRQRTDELLERTAAELVRATEALACQETSLFRRSGPSLPTIWSDFRRVYVPVIVTTAKLLVCNAVYENLNLETGDVPAANAAEEPIVTFTKSLVSINADQSTDSRIEQFSQQSERSVLIVQATDFLDFLSNFELSKERPDLLAYLLRR